MAKKEEPFLVYCEPSEVGIPRRIKDGTATLVINDPPYNQGVPYADYDDNKSAADYLAWTKHWLTVSHRALATDGSLWVFIPDEWVSEVDIFCRHSLRMTRRNWITWVFTFGQAARKSFTRSHVHLLYFTKHKSKFVFNADQIRVPSARQAVYKDKRANGKGKLPDDTWALLKQDLELCLPNDGDVWLESRVCGTYKARQKHAPNQIPLPLLDRIVKTCSRPGDLVVDPCNGTGSTGESALRLGRRYVGFDISEKLVRATTKRLAAVTPILTADGPVLPLFEGKKKRGK